MLLLRGRPMVCMGVSFKLSVSNQQLRRPPTPFQSPVSYLCEPGQQQRPVASEALADGRTSRKASQPTARSFPRRLHPKAAVNSSPLAGGAADRGCRTRAPVRIY